MTPDDLKILISSDVVRDGIGIEAYINDAIILSIYRHDTEKKRLMTLYKENVPLEIIEKCIEIFNKEIPKEFCE